MQEKVKRILIPILCILWISLIFIMSSDTGSFDKTMNVSDTVAEQIQGTDGHVADQDVVSFADRLNLIIRKSGHFIEYMILCILLLKTGESFGIPYKQSAGYILLICLIIANLDEFYQGFVPGRNASVLDSLIDLGGSFFGAAMYVGIARIKKKRV